MNRQHAPSCMLPTSVSDKRGYVDPASPEAVPGRARRRVTFQSFGCGSEARAGGLAVIIA